MGRLDGKVAFITGGARGQGLEAAKLFAREGARVVLGDLLDAEGKESANTIGDDAHFVHLDVTNDEDWKTAVAEAELQLAGQVISSLSGEWTPEDFANDYREDLKQMLEAKLAGHEVVAPEPVAETPVIDLMEALRQSVADAQGRRAAKGSENGKAAPKSGSRSRKTPARKSA